MTDPAPNVHDKQLSPVAEAAAGCLPAANVLAERRDSQAAPLASPGVQMSPMGMMQMIIERAKDINPAAIPGMMKELVALEYMVEDRNAAKEWATSMRAFQNECPGITKNRKTKEVNSDEGSGFAFSWSDLPHILKIVRPYLAKHGFSVRWDTEDGQGKVTSICYVKHDNGHVESSRATALDAGAPKSSPGHKHTGAWSVSRRLSLISVLALIDTEDEPQDGSGVGMKPITKSQHESIMSYLAELGQPEGGFAAIFGISDMKQLPVVKFADAMRMLDARKKAKVKGATS